MLRIISELMFWNSKSRKRFFKSISLAKWLFMKALSRNVLNDHLMSEVNNKIYDFETSFANLSFIDKKLYSDEYKELTDFAQSAIDLVIRSLDTMKVSESSSSQEVKVSLDRIFKYLNRWESMGYNTVLPENVVQHLTLIKMTYV